jgi:hypothetical protein
MIAIGIKNRIKKGLSNFISAYDTYTVGLLIAGVIIIAVELLKAA